MVLCIVVLVVVVVDLAISSYREDEVLLKGRWTGAHIILYPSSNSSVFTDNMHA
jgi:hypothetical protein